MAITADMVKKLREKTGAGMMDCKKALSETEGDMEKAIDMLRAKGQATSEKRAGKAAREGLIGSYIHRPAPSGRQTRHLDTERPKLLDVRIPSLSHHPQKIGCRAVGHGPKEPATPGRLVRKQGRIPACRRSESCIRSREHLVTRWVEYGQDGQPSRRPIPCHQIRQIQR